MNVWTKIEPSANPKGSWPKVAARRLRAWWARLFPRDMQPAETAGGESESLLPQSFNTPESEDALLANDAGPVDEWLALVQEGAPGLLISPEQGGTRWQLASDDMNENIDDPENAAIPARAITPADFPVSPAMMSEGPAERRALRERAPLRATAGAIHKPSLAQTARLKTRQPKERNEAFLQNRPGSKQASTPESQRSPVKAEHTNLAQEGCVNNPARPAGNWMDVAQRKFKQLLSSRQQTRPGKDGAGNNITAAELEKAEHKRAETSHTFIAGTQTISSGSPARSRSVRAWPQLQVAPSTTQSGGNQAVQRRDREQSPSLPMTNTVTGTSPRAIPFEKPIPEMTMPSSRETSLGAGDLPAAWSTQAVDFDPWPELPDDPSLNSPDWMESLRSRAHIHALEFEQRGEN